MGYDDFQDSPGMITSNELLCDKAFDFDINIAKNPEYDGYKIELLQFQIF